MKQLPQRPDFELAKKLLGPSQMTRVRAAREIIHSYRGNAEALALFGFMAIFHPEVPEATVREMCRDRRDR